MKLKATLSKPLLFRFFKSKKVLRAAVLRSDPASRLGRYLPPVELLSQDLWSWGQFWGLITSKISTVEALYSSITNRQMVIEKAKEAFRPLIKNGRGPHLIAPYASIAAPTGTFYLDTSRVIPIPEKDCGAYYLICPKGEKRFIIKPIDEEVGALHNPKGFASPFKRSPNGELLYTTLREPLAYQVASSLGLSSVCLRSYPAILHSDRFHDLSDDISISEIPRYRKNCGTPFKEKLCSVQEYLPQSKPLASLLQDFETAGLSPEEIASRFDPLDLEDAHLLAWILQENRAQFLVFAKGIDPIGNEILGLKYSGSSQTEHRLPNLGAPVSPRTKAKIKAIDSQQLFPLFKSYGDEEHAAALEERIAQLMADLL